MRGAVWKEQSEGWEVDLCMIPKEMTTSDLAGWRVWFLVDARHCLFHYL